MISVHKSENMSDNVQAAFLSEGFWIGGGPDTYRTSLKDRIEEHNEEDSESMESRREQGDL